MSWLRGQTLLMVEDDFLLADCLSEALRDEGVIVVGPAPSVAHAHALLDREKRIDAAILDVNVRGESIFPVADALMARQVPFIFVSGYDRALIPPRFEAVKHCIKPVDVETVAKALAEIDSAYRHSGDAQA